MHHDKLFTDVFMQVSCMQGDLRIINDILQKSLTLGCRQLADLNSTQQEWGTGIT